MPASEIHQQMDRVAYLGPRGTFSHETAIKHYPQAEPLPAKTLAEVVQMVADGRTELGMVPFFNNHAKSISEVQYAIAQNRGRVFVSGVAPTEIKHCLFAHGGLGEIQEVLTKDAAFSQVSTWLGRHLPNTRKISCDSTADALMRVEQGKSPIQAAIASRMAGEFYKVPLLHEDIQNIPNTTVFAEIRPRASVPSSFEHILVFATDMTEIQKQHFALLAVVERCRIAHTVSIAPRHPKDSSLTMFDIDADPEFPMWPQQKAFDDIIMALEGGMDLKNFFFAGGYSGISLATFIKIQQKLQLETLENKSPRLHGL